MTPSAPDCDRERPRRLAFVVDNRGWAFENAAKNIAALLAPEYEVSIYYIIDYRNLEELFYHVYLQEKYGYIHFFWREDYFKNLDNIARLVKLSKKAGIGLHSLASCITNAVTTACVCDHLFLEPAAVAEREEKFALLDAYSTSSRRLFREYGRLFRHPPACITRDGVNLDIFRPRNLDRFDLYDRPLVIGWAGNSLWPRAARRPGRDDVGYDPKGLRTLVIPAIEGLRAEGLNIVSSFADRNVKWRSHDQMPLYYSELDILVCASEHEGTPNPVLEAMACGVPVLSTDVGIVAEAFGPEQTRFLIPERSISAIKRLIRQLDDDRSRLRTLSRENLESIRAWSWQRQVPDWRQLFEQARINHVARRDEKREKMLSLAETAWQERHRWLGLYRPTRRLKRKLAPRKL